MNSHGNCRHTCGIIEVMRVIGLPRPNEQRKIEKLLVKLAKIKPISAIPAPIANRSIAARTA